MSAYHQLSRGDNVCQSLMEAYCITTGTIWFRPSTILGFIRRNLRHCTSNLKQTAYIKLVRSVMDYSCVVWDPYLRKNIDKLEHIQRRAARFVKNDYRRDSSGTAMLQDLKWQPLADRHRDQRLILLYKIINPRRSTHSAKPETLEK